ncbi:hypothetical protein GWK47_051346 [Chionoecetes opilio]|uniref:Uncharacterized protein n=1 Tax=Chionoecetes opilio TaxID=41210 RepID=A0A8J4YA04_CHIOP|nr:hypothetical protein GWK47_051346 [Chionoecetes opilio]
MTSTRRRPEDPPDDAGFTLQRKRFRVTKHSSQQSGATAAERPIPVWRVVRHDDFPSPYQLVRPSFGSPSRWMSPPPGSSFSGRGATEDAAATLQEVADGQPRGIVLARREPSRRGILVGYPTGLPLDPVLEHPLIVSAVRCSYSAGLKRHLPTRQVQLTLQGHVPAVLDLGCFGTARQYDKAFGHYQRQCQRRQELCGVCSGEHASRACIRLLREGGERPVARCHNCDARHHAWNRRCPARLRLIPGSTVPRQLQWKEAPLLPPRSTSQPPVPRNEDAAETRRPRRRRRRKRPQRNRLLSPVGDMDVDAQAPVMTQVPAPLEMAAVGGELQLAVAPPPCRRVPVQAAYLFGRPALSYVRQALREGRRPGVRLPTERPIDMPAYHRRRVPEPLDLSTSFVSSVPPSTSNTSSAQAQTLDSLVTIVDFPKHSGQKPVDLSTVFGQFVHSPTVSNISSAQHKLDSPCYYCGHFFHKLHVSSLLNCYIAVNVMLKPGPKFVRFN